MWKLKIAGEGEGNPWLRTLNNHIGRQVWEFDPNFTPASPSQKQMLLDIDAARLNFHNNRFSHPHSSDFLLRIQNSDVTEVLLPPKVNMDGIEDVTEESVTTTLRRALSFHSSLQSHDGHWPGDYGGPMFLLPGLIITLFVTGAQNATLTQEHKKEMCRYLYNHQNMDGGWGLHIESPSTMLGSALNYVTLRLLGQGPNDGQGQMEKAHNWILCHGGATFITSWGKLWLSVK